MGMRGKDYWWCHTESSWDYCSPHGLVKPVQLTTRGSLCLSECAQGGKNYHWCYKSLDYCSEDSCDDDWDYCAPQELRTTYNYPCEGECKKDGEKYFWCKKGDSWDYCSPTAKFGNSFSDKVELTIYGAKCRDKCTMKGEKYYWCMIYGRTSTNWWDYCSPDARTTRYTDKSWEYCSAAYGPRTELGYESLHAGARMLTIKAQLFLLLCPFVSKM